MKVKKLGMDVRMIHHSGIGVRIQNILKFWKEISDLKIYLFGDPIALNSYQLPKNSEIIPYYSPIYSIREWLGHPRMKDMDILDIPHFNAPLIYLSRSQVTIHDLIPWVMREYHSTFVKRIYLNIVLPLVLKYSFKIVTVSEFTRSDIYKQFPRIQREISVIPNGIDHSLYQIKSKNQVQAFTRKYNLPKKFLLTIGIGKGHKNQEFLLECLGEEWKRNPNLPRLVIAGTKGSIPEYLKELYYRNKEFVHILPRIPDHEMPLLYQSSNLLIYPSLYEGFGFPVVEASAMSTLVLASNATVIPEVLGNGAIFFDPRSNSDFSIKLNQALSLSPNKKKELLNLSKNKAKSYDWNITMESYFQKMESK